MTGTPVEASLRDCLIINLEGHQNSCIGLQVTAILLNGWILPIAGASAVEGMRSTELPRLVT